MAHTGTEQAFKEGVNTIKKMNIDIKTLDLDKEMDVISVSSSFKGDFQFGRYTRIEGSINGTIRSSGTLIIGEQAKINADIDGKTVVINGSLEGDVTASDIICVGDTAQINGRLKAPKIDVSDGAKINGELIMARFHPKFKELENR